MTTRYAVNRRRGPHQERTTAARWSSYEDPDAATNVIAVAASTRPTV